MFWANPVRQFQFGHVSWNGPTSKPQVTAAETVCTQVYPLQSVRLWVSIANCELVQTD